MKITATETTYKEVDVSKSNLIKYVIAIIEKQFDLDDNYISNGRLVRWENTSHGYEKNLGEPSPEQLEADKHIKYLINLAQTIKG